MCVYVCVFVCVYVYICTENVVHRLGESHQKTSDVREMYTYIHTHLYICVYVSVFVCVCVCVCVCIHTQKKACNILEEVIKKWATSYARAVELAPGSEKTGALEFVALFSKPSKGVL